MELESPLKNKGLAEECNLKPKPPPFDKTAEWQPIKFLDNETSAELRVHFTFEAILEQCHKQLMYCILDSLKIQSMYMY